MEERTDDEEEEEEEHGVFRLEDLLSSSSDDDEDKEVVGDVLGDSDQEDKEALNVLPQEVEDDEEDEGEAGAEHESRHEFKHEKDVVEERVDEEEDKRAEEVDKEEELLEEEAVQPASREAQHSDALEPEDSGPTSSSWAEAALRELYEDEDEEEDEADDGDEDEEDEVEEVVDEGHDELGQADTTSSQRVQHANKYAQQQQQQEEEHAVSPLAALQAAEDAERAQAESRAGALDSDDAGRAGARPMRIRQRVDLNRQENGVTLAVVETAGAVSNTLGLASTRNEHGTPLVVSLHASGHALAVGMSRGTVLVSRITAPSDRVVALGVIGGPAVVAVDFSSHGEWLLCGYANGSLTLWDVSKSAMLKTVVGEHSAPVVHVAFIPQRPAAVTADANGVTTLHTFTAVPLLRRYTVSSQCLLDGSRTRPVLSLAALPTWPSSLSPASPAQTPISPPTPTESASSTSLSGMATSVFSTISNTATDIRTAAATNVDAGLSFLYDQQQAGGGAGGVICIITQQKAIIVRLFPVMEITHRWPRPANTRDGALPVCAWRRQDSRDVNEGTHNNNGEVDTPTMAVAWGHSVSVLRMRPRGEVESAHELKMEAEAVNVRWLDEQVLGVLLVRGSTSTLCLCSLDGEVLQRVGVPGGSDALAHHNFFTNSSGTPERAFHNSMASRGSSLYILGNSQLLHARVLAWKERLAYLCGSGDWMAAFRLALDYYDRTAKLMSTLPSNDKDLPLLRRTLRPSLLPLLSDFIDGAIAAAETEAIEEVMRRSAVIESGGEGGGEGDGMDIVDVIQARFVAAGEVAVEFCVHVGELGALFGGAGAEGGSSVFGKFDVAGQRATFIDLLEPYILTDTLTALPPEVMQALVDQYSQRGWLQRVEQCILHMDIASLDFNQVVKLCRAHGLYNALIYVFNSGLDDYVTPAAELLAVSRAASDDDDRKALAYKLLVYLKHCFTGKAFPPGRASIAFPPDRYPHLLQELIQFLLRDESTPSSPYGRLRFLLDIDCAATLAVLAEAFLTTTSAGTISDLSAWSGSTDSARMSIADSDPQAQMVVDAVLTLAAPDDIEFLEDEIGAMLEFVAAMLAARKCVVASKDVMRVLTHLITGPAVASAKSATSARKDLTVAVLLAVPHEDVDAELLLNLSAEAESHQVSALLHYRLGRMQQAMGCLLADASSRPLQPFAFINHCFRQGHRDKFSALLLERLPALARLDCNATLTLAAHHVSPRDHESAIMTGALAADPRLQYSYLQALIITMNDNNNMATGETAAAEYLRSSGFQMTDALNELYLQRLCEFDPAQVRPFLVSCNGYRLDRCLELCQQHAVVDASAYLLEQMGDVTGALALLLRSLEQQIAAVEKAARKGRIVPAKVTFGPHAMPTSPRSRTNNNNNLSTFTRSSSSSSQLTEATAPEIVAMQEVVDNAVELCLRNTGRLPARESEALWFELLDRFAVPLRELKRAERERETRRASLRKKLRTTTGERKPTSLPQQRRMAASAVLQQMLAGFITSIMGSMTGLIPLSAILGHIVEKHGGDEVGDFKPSIMGMLASYGYERAILGTARHLMARDTFDSMQELRLRRSRAAVPASIECTACGLPLSSPGRGSDESGNGSPRNDRGVLKVFSCGHSFHGVCVPHGKASGRGAHERCPACLTMHERPVIAHALHSGMRRQNGVVA